MALNGLPTLAQTPAPTASASATPITTPTPCAGDCDDSGAVTVDELVKGVNIALDNADMSTCVQLDADGNGIVTVDEIVKAVNVRSTAAGNLQPQTSGENFN